MTRTTGDGYAAPGKPVNGSDSGPATKLFEDLAIQITPSDTDEVRDNHTFTATVFHNFGDGAGFVHEVAGVPVQLALTDSNGASSSPVCAPCNLTTDANGRVSQTFSSSTPGQTVGKASVTETLDGANLTRTTGDGYAAPGNPANGSDGPNATKTWVDAYIEINPPKGTNPAVDDAHVHRHRLGERRPGRGVRACPGWDPGDVRIRRFARRHDQVHEPEPVHDAGRLLLGGHDLDQRRP